MWSLFTISSWEGGKRLQDKCVNTIAYIVKAARPALLGGDGRVTREALEGAVNEGKQNVLSPAFSRHVLATVCFLIYRHRWYQMAVTALCQLVGCWGLGCYPSGHYHRDFLSSSLNGNKTGLIWQSRSSNCGKVWCKVAKSRLLRKVHFGTLWVMWIKLLMPPVWAVVLQEKKQFCK